MKLKVNKAFFWILIATGLISCGRKSLQSSSVKVNEYRKFVDGGWTRNDKVAYKIIRKDPAFLELRSVSKWCNYSSGVKMVVDFTAEGREDVFISNTDFVNDTTRANTYFYTRFSYPSLNIIEPKDLGSKVWGETGITGDYASTIFASDWEGNNTNLFFIANPSQLIRNHSPSEYYLENKIVPENAILEIEWVNFGRVSKLIIQQDLNVEKKYRWRCDAWEDPSEH